MDYRGPLLSAQGRPSSDDIFSVAFTRCRTRHQCEHFAACLHSKLKSPHPVSTSPKLSPATASLRNRFAPHPARKCRVHHPQFTKLRIGTGGASHPLRRIISCSSLFEILARSGFARSSIAATNDQFPAAIRSHAPAASLPESAACCSPGRPAKTRRQLP